MRIQKQILKIIRSPTKSYLEANWQFVHVPRTAGTTIKYLARLHFLNNILSNFIPVNRHTVNPSFMISTLLRLPPITNRNSNKHFTYTDLSLHHQRRNSTPPFFFACFREPYSWHYSIYKYIMKNSKHPEHHLTREFPSFSAYLRYRYINQHQDQTSYIRSSMGSQVNYTINFSDISNSTENLLKKIYFPELSLLSQININSADTSQFTADIGTLDNHDYAILNRLTERDRRTFDELFSC